VEPHDPLPNFFRITTGTWVEFTTQREGDQTKRRGYVKLVEGTLATVFDEHSFAEVRKGMYCKGTNSRASQFKIETRKLEISRTQAPSLPKNDTIHPLTGQRVVVVSGPHKALYGNIKEVGATTMSVEITTFFVTLLRALCPTWTFGGCLEYQRTTPSTDTAYLKEEGSYRS
jgi:hypothetical protein